MVVFTTVYIVYMAFTSVFITLGLCTPLVISYNIKCKNANYIEVTLSLERYGYTAIFSSLTISNCKYNYSSLLVFLLHSVIVCKNHFFPFFLFLTLHCNQNPEFLLFIIIMFLRKWQLYFKCLRSKIFRWKISSSLLVILQRGPPPSGKAPQSIWGDNRAVFNAWQGNSHCLKAWRGETFPRRRTSARHSSYPLLCIVRRVVRSNFMLVVF